MRVRNGYALQKVCVPSPPVLEYADKPGTRKMKIEPPGIATAIGSFPHRETGAICDRILAKLPSMPCWPQLQKRDFKEQMYVQASEGLPCAVVDEENERIYFDTSGDIYPALEECLTHVIADDVEHFGISEDYAAGLHEMVRKLGGKKPDGLRWVKGQTVGPVSLGLTVTDQTRRAIIYNDELFEAINKCCVMKARWQVRTLKSVHPEVVIFIDEPYLSSFGSAYINIQRDQVVGLLTEIIDAVHGEGAVAGVHCCGNTDWSLLMDTPIDIINFDAHGYFEGMALYPEKLGAFLEGGGVLAWGIVPTSEEIAGLSHEDLLKEMEKKVDVLEKKGVDRGLLAANRIITPSCGTGTLSVELSERVLDVTDLLSKTIQS